jgi:hypothetical protein
MVDVTTTHRITTAAALILSVAAAGAPAASARPQGPDAATGGNQPPAVANQAPAVYSRQDKSTVPPASPSTSAVGTAPSTSSGGIAKASAAPTVIRVQAPSSGFDWGDAGIGAAGGLALAMLGLGGALAISSQRRARHPNIPTAPTS